MARKSDAFANKFYGEVVESAAHTLTFAEIPTNVDVFSKKAWVLHRLDWYLETNPLNLFDASGDKIQAALVSSDKINSLGLDNPAVIDLFELFMTHSTGVGYQLITQPFQRNFSEMPGGGLIISPRPLFLAIQGVSTVVAATMSCRGYFTAMDLNADEYLELVDFYRIVQ